MLRPALLKTDVTFASGTTFPKGTTGLAERSMPGFVTFKPADADSEYSIQHHRVRYLDERHSCPECDAQLLPASGCLNCPCCGWSAC